MAKDKVLMQSGLDNTDWDEQTKADFIKLCLDADGRDFNLMCGVGFNKKLAKAGELRLTAFFSPRASTNPHFTDLLDDLAMFFRRMAERQRQ